MKIAIKCLITLLAGASFGADQAGAEAPKWDRIANIREMATHIGNVQRSQGADKAMAFIDACYRTHGLGSGYSKSFEGCIVADYLLAQALVAVINRVPAEELRKTGMAAPEEIKKAVRVRIGSAFGQYGIGAADANAFVALTQEHGTTPFLKAVFPDAQPDDQVKK
jgi:hypothetical protein